MFEDASIIDVLQEYIETMGWDFDRLSNATIKFVRVGEWQTYTFYVVETSNGSIALTNSYPFEVPKKTKKKSRRKLKDLFNLLHGDVPLGTFSYGKSVDGVQYQIAWAYRFFISPTTQVDDEVIEALLDEAIAEIDEMYPSFQMVVTKGVSIEEAYHNAIPDAYGHA